MIYQKREIGGFTMIEVIIVIAILAILATVAVPRLFSVSGDAQTAATKSVAAALSSANGENYAVRIEKNTNGSAVSNCTAVGSLLQGGLPSGYTCTFNPNPVAVFAPSATTGSPLGTTVTTTVSITPPATAA